MELLQAIVLEKDEMLAARMLELRRRNKVITIEYYHIHLIYAIY